MNSKEVAQDVSGIAENQDWTRVWHHPALDVGLLQAHYVRHSYPWHSHDYYVICVIEGGFQSFTHAGTKHMTPPGGVILINPGSVHTGEAADARGFQMRSLYPTTSHMQAAAFELTGRHQALPFFADVRVDDSVARNQITSLHRALAQGASEMECEARFIQTLAQLVKQYAGTRHDEQRLGREQRAVERVRQYIDEYFAEGIRLSQLAEYVSLSPYYLLRVFKQEVGMPPYAYLESVRVRHAQRLIQAGKPLAEVAAEVGFSSQSHLTNHFKQIIGATPGQYAESLKAR